MDNVELAELLEQKYHKSVSLDCDIYVLLYDIRIKIDRADFLYKLNEPETFELCDFVILEKLSPTAPASEITINIIDDGW